MYKKHSELVDSRKSSFTNMVSMYKVETFEVDARNRQDVERALQLELQRKDEVVSITPKKGTIYECVIRRFVLVDGPPENWE